MPQKSHSAPPPPSNSHFSFWFSFLTCQHHTSSSLNKSSQSLTKKKNSPFLIYPKTPALLGLALLQPKNITTSISQRRPQKKAQETPVTRSSQIGEVILCFRCMLLLPYKRVFPQIDTPTPPKQK